jgi:putative SOS response-associated peptidase YedK
MCGRYGRRSDKQKTAEAFAVHGRVLADFGPSWNIAPQTLQPVTRLNRDTDEREIIPFCLPVHSKLDGFPLRKLSDLTFNRLPANKWLFH